MEVNFTRGDEIAREALTISAELYNKIHLVFSNSGNDCLFVPIRTMQYMAVIDTEEIIFVDGQGRRHIEIAWCGFLPRERQTLRDPVSFTCIYYDTKGYDIMKRIHGEFLKALTVLEEKLPKKAGATITQIDRDQ